MEKQILQAALLQTRADEEPDGLKSKALVNRVLKIKEDVTRAATARTSSMCDQEERAVVLASVKALKRGDVERALRILEERLKKISRRIEFHSNDSDEDSDVSGPPIKDIDIKETEETPTKPNSTVTIPEMSPEDWNNIVGGILNVSDCPEAEAGSNELVQTAPVVAENFWPDGEHYKHELQKRGFILANGVQPAAPLCTSLIKVHSFNFSFLTIFFTQLPNSTSLHLCSYGCITSAHPCNVHTFWFLCFTRCHFSVPDVPRDTFP
jgi:hypothetical protein